MAVRKRGQAPFLVEGSSGSQDNRVPVPVSGQPVNAVRVGELMALFWLLFGLGAFNVCLGYALAVYLGYGLPSLRDAWIAIGIESFPGKMPAAGAVAPAGPAPQAPASIDQLLDTDAGEHLAVEPYDEPYDDDVAELLRPESPEVWDLNEKFVETSILRLNVAMMKSGMRATEIDTRLREVMGQADAGTIQRSLDELKTDCELYLTEQSDAASKLHDRINELGEFASSASRSRRPTWSRSRRSRPR